MGEAAEAPPDQGPRRRSVDPIVGWILFAAALALAVRLVYVLAFRQHVELGGDDFVYHEQARLLADGHAWISPIFRTTGDVSPQADHPPLVVAALGAASFVGLDTLRSHLVIMALGGAVTVLLVGVLARRIAGDRAAIIAAVVAALYPGLWAWDGRTLSEGPAATLTTAAVLVALWARDRATAWRVLVLATLCTLAGLARAEMLLLLPLLGIPVIARGVREPDRSNPFLMVGAAVLPVLVLVGPWAAWNTARFEEPVALSTGLGRAMASGACDPAFSGPLAGYWDLNCLGPVVQEHPGLDESQYDRLYRDEAATYLREHATATPRVLALRWARAFYGYRPLQQIELDQIAEGKEPLVAGSGLTTYYAIAGAALAGGVAVRRRHQPLWPLAAPFICVLVGTALAFGSVRYRAPVEGVLVALGAVGFDALLRRLDHAGRIGHLTAAALAVGGLLVVGSIGAVIGDRHQPPDQPEATAPFT